MCLLCSERRPKCPNRPARGERKRVTVLFADLKGSMELLADRDPEKAWNLLDPALESTMEAVHRYEGTVNQVMGDGILISRTCCFVPIDVEH